MEFISHHPNDLHVPAKELIKRMDDKNIITFEGEMGAGKTTFIKALCKELGVNDDVSSPTFSLVNEYLLPDGSPVFHFDFYRINHISEAEDIGIYEYFDQGICLIEWGEKIDEILKMENRIEVSLKVLSPTERIISF